MGRKKLTQEEVERYLKEYGYTLQDNYINVNTKIKTICPNGHVYETKLSSFKEGRRCPKCRQVSYETVRENVEKMGFKLITQKEEYINASMKLKVKCCNGHLQEKRYDSFLSNKGCWVCRNENKKLKYEDVKLHIESEGYKLLSKEYAKASEYIELECPNGHKYKTTYASFKQGGRCKKCLHQSYRLSYNEVKDIFKSEGYTLLSENYINLKENLDVECPSGHRFEISLSNFKWGKQRCLNCQDSNISKGEREVKRVLEKFEIDFTQQYKFKDCRDKRELPFDFYIPSKNIVIEFDGEQHFKEKEKFGGILGFAQTILHDCIKNNYCINNNIKLIRIPYWEIDNIESILKQQINLE